jgi:hypothetical protein
MVARSTILVGAISFSISEPFSNSRYTIRITYDNTKYLFWYCSWTLRANIVAYMLRQLRLRLPQRNKFSWRSLCFVYSNNLFTQWHAHTERRTHRRSSSYTFPPANTQVNPNIHNPFMLLSMMTKYLETHGTSVNVVAHHVALWHLRVTLTSSA